MIYVLELNENNCKFLKFYDNEKLAIARQGKKWTLNRYENDLPQFTAKGVTDVTQKPKFIVKAGNLEIPTLTEGMANSVMMELTRIFGEAHVFRAESEVPEETIPSKGFLEL